MLKIKKIMSLILVAVFVCGMGFGTWMTDVKATELTQEEQDELYRQELEKIYNQPIQSNEWANWPKGPGTYGESAIIMDAGTGAILYAKDIDEQLYPASITKVLTALIAFENAELTDPVVVTRDCVSFLQPGDSSIALKEGDQLSMEDTLYATLLASANEAAYAVGENVGKNAGHDYNWFIEQMNTRMKELGGTNSNFTNTNGLHDDNHYTTVHDMALVGKELFKHPEFFTIVQTTQYTIEETDTVEEHIFQQKHKMLLEGYEAYYEPTIGGKTGYTSVSRNTLITMADNGEQQLICVVMREEGGKSYPDTTALFEYTFDNFKRTNISDFIESEDVGEILTEQGGGYVTLPEGVDVSELEMELIPDDALTGEGTVNYTYEGRLVGNARVKLSDSYMEANAISIEDAEEPESDEEDGLGIVKIVLIGALVVLVLLILLFVVALIKRERRRRRRREQMRRRRQRERERRMAAGELPQKGSSAKGLPMKEDGQRTAQRRLQDSQRKHDR